MTEAADRSEGSGGFTLLELLIAITILGLILVALTNGVRFAGQAWQVQETRSARQGDLDAVLNVVRNLIVSGTGFNGDRTSLHLVSTLPEALARGGLYDVELHAVSGRLAIRWKSHFKGADPGAKTTDTELARNIRGLDIAYYSQPGGWGRVVRENSKPPTLIMLTLQFGDGRILPPLIVAPMVEVVPPVTK